MSDIVWEKARVYALGFMVKKKRFTICEVVDAVVKAVGINRVSPGITIKDYIETLRQLGLVRKVGVHTYEWIGGDHE